MSAVSWFRRPAQMPAAAGANASAGANAGANADADAMSADKETLWTSH
jgi:hypothetical protein